MPKTPRISIIIPAYNGERYLDECIQSVYQQTCPDFEIIVVDDCSTDDTAVIAERL
jgi:glycosyltransferase involved in cell wall biosynthesis